MDVYETIKADELPSISDYYDESELETWNNLSRESQRERWESEFCDWTKEIENLISERSSKESVCFN